MNVAMAGFLNMVSWNGKQVWKLTKPQPTKPQNPTNETSVLVTTSSNENLDQARNSEPKNWIEHQIYAQILLV